MNQPPTWAGRSVPAGGSEGGPEPSSDRGPLLPILATAALVVLVGGAGFFLGRSNSDDDVDAGAAATTETTATETTAAESPTTEPTTSESEATEVSATGDETTTTEAPAETTTTEAPAETTTTEAPAEEPAEDPANETQPDDETERRAILSGGVLYLRGEIPDPAVGEFIVERAAAVVGPDNVVNEYVINPDAPLPESAPLFVEDVVLFAYGSDQVNPAFIPLLDLGILLMSQNPTVVVTVVSHTDSDGSEEFNQRLSERRGQAVADYWLERGIDSSQIVIDARGERDPVADNNTSEGAQLNRRAEFIITGLLG